MKPDAARAQYLWRTYGLTLEQYEGMFNDQQGQCWICQWTWRPGKRRLAVDHDHQSGAVRGLLCYRCNKGLGVFRDNITALARASKYLEQPWVQRGWIAPKTRKRWRRRGMRQLPRHIATR